jgi:N-acetylglutamate synthase-like GNAT family acetyltransferase
MMAMDFKEVVFGSSEYKELLDIRNEVLRKPIGMVLRPKDIASDKQEYHLAAFDNGKAIGCVLLRPLDNGSIQLRQMAILDNYRGQNIGAKLVQFAEQIALNKKFKIIETRARKTAEGFYKKLGYISYPNEFEDEHTLKMAKVL